MSCENCMKYRPDIPQLSQEEIHQGYRNEISFTCPECGEIYVLAGVGPGNYWETKKEHDKEKEECDKRSAKLKENI